MRLKYHQPVCFRIGQWLNHPSVDVAEDGRVCSDAERKSEDCDRSEARIPCERAKTVSNVHEKVFYRRPAPDCAAVLLHQSDIPEVATSGGGGFFSGHAAGNKCFDFFLKMRLNLFGKIVVEGAARKQLFKPIHDSPDAKIRVVPSSIRSGPSLVPQCDH